MGGNPLRVHLPALRFGNSPTGIHQGLETGCGLAEAIGNKTYNLSRRHSNSSLLQGIGRASCGNSNLSSRKSRAYDKSRKVYSNPSNRDGVSGFSSQLCDLNIVSSKRHDKEGKEGMSGGHGLSPNYYQTANKTVRSSLFHYPGSFSSSPPLPPLTGGKKRSIRSRPLLRLTDISPSSRIRETDLVERQFRGMEWKGSRFWNSRYGNRDRCFAQGLGSILHGGFHWRAMGPGGNPAPYQLSGTASGSFCHTNVCKRQSSYEGLPAYGQHDSSPLYKQDGMNKIPHSRTFGCRSVELVSRSPDSHRGPVHSRSSECTSRQGIQSHVRSSRLETRPQGLFRVKSTVGSFGSRPICFAPHHSTTLLLQLATRPSRRSHGRVFTGLDLSTRVCIPTIRAHRPMPAKTSRPGGVSSSISSSGLEIPTVVPVTARVMYSQSSSSTTVSRPFDTSGGNASVGSAPTSRMAAISRSYSEAGISKGRKNYSLLPGEKVPPLHIPQLGENGIAGAVNGKLIQFSHQLNAY